MTIYTYDSALLSDLYKDAYGFRPSGSYLQAWTYYTDEFKQEIWDRLLAEVKRAVEETEQYHADKQYQADKDDSHD